MNLLDILAVSISVVSVAIALSALVYTWLSNKPRVRGRLNYILPSPLAIAGDSEGSRTTALMAHVTLTNLGRHPVFIQDYQLEIDRGGGYKSIKRLTRITGFPQLKVGQDSIKLKEWREWLIYYPQKPVEYGSPLSGMLVFFIQEPLANLEGKITRYRVTAEDVFGRRYTFEATPEEFIDSGRLVEMFQIGGAEVTTPDLA